MKAIVVGCGVIADRWVRVLTADPRVEVVALVDPQLDRAERLAARLCPQAAPTTSLPLASATYPADMVVNLNPPELHAAVTREALTAGLHVLTEKPVALRLSDAVELAELAYTNRLTLAVMHSRAHDPRFRTFAHTVTSAVRGPFAVTADVVVDLRGAGFRRDQRSRPFSLPIRLRSLRPKWPCPAPSPSFGDCGLGQTLFWGAARASTSQWPLGTDRDGYRAMLARDRRHPERVWAVEGCDGIGRHIAQRLVADGGPRPLGNQRDSSAGQCSPGDSRLYSLAVRVDNFLPLGRARLSWSTSRSDIRHRVLAA